MQNISSRHKLFCEKTICRYFTSGENDMAEMVRQVGRATLQEKSWSGGRYGCARALKDELAELQHYSLGQVQHLGQLALKKKILGYQGGQLAPYVRAECTSLKERTEEAENNSS